MDVGPVIPSSASSGRRVEAGIAWEPAGLPLGAGVRAVVVLGAYRRP